MPDERIDPASLRPQAMPEIITRNGKRFVRQKGRRRFWGWTFVILFWVVNIAMLGQLLELLPQYTQARLMAEKSGPRYYDDLVCNPTCVKTKKQDPHNYEYNRLDHYTGMILGLIVRWIIAAAFFGTLVHFTRGKEELIEVETESD
jgi:hypothetical protein